MADDISKRNISYAEAIAYANARKVVLPDEYYGKLIGVQRSQSISVAGLASVEQIKFIVDKLDDVLKKGGTFKDFQDAVKDNSLAIDLPAFRLDNIFRTNIQSAYARGRWDQQAKVAGTRPFLMYDAINDGRTRPTHHAMDGTILPRTDPWWDSHYPPNGYRCRCTVISLTQAQAEKRGGVKKAPGNAVPDDGWAYNPGTDYAGPVDKTLVKTIDELTQKVPAATKAAQKARKAIQKKAEPITLDSVMERGRKAIMELGEWDGSDYILRLEDMVMKATMGAAPRRSGLGVVTDAARKQIAAHVDKHMPPNKWYVGQNKTYLKDDQYKERLKQRLPLPGKWLKAVSERYSNVSVIHSDNRAYALQGAGELSLTVERGSVVVHEFMHLVQHAFPEIQDLANQMHAKRTAGAKPKKLKDLFPNSNYRDVEVTKEDKYHSAYMGKEYAYQRDGSRVVKQTPLEILAVAMEDLLGDVTSAFNKTHAGRRKMIAQDRETFEFALGLILSYA